MFSGDFLVSIFYAKKKKNLQPLEFVHDRTEEKNVDNGRYPVQIYCHK